jgi:hypothetical protein
MADAWGTSWGAAWGESWDADATPEIAAEVANITAAFAMDMSAIRLLPHEARQLRRIRQIAKRDKAHALLALRLFRKRAAAARAALRVRARP